MLVREWDTLLAEVARLEPPSDLGRYVVQRAEQAQGSPASGRGTRPHAKVAVRWAAGIVGVVAVVAGLALAAHSRSEPETVSAPSVSEAKLAVLRQSFAPSQSWRRYASLAEVEAKVGFSVVRPQARLASDANLDSIWAPQTHEVVVIWKSGIVETIKPWNCHCDPTDLRKEPKPIRYLTINGWPATTAPSSPSKRINQMGIESSAEAKYGVPASVEVVHNGLDVVLYQYGKNVQPGLLAVANTLPTRPATSLTITYRHNAFQHHNKLLKLSNVPLFLSCDPASGTLPNPARACHLIQTNPMYIGEPTGTCAGSAIRWDVKITGTIRDNPVSRDYDMCAYPQARAWTDLGGTNLGGIIPGQATNP
jgi:hypothetical protein